MKPKPDEPRGWSCDCGNVLGVMHRNSSRIMVLDVFRMQVHAGQFKVTVAMALPVDYSMMNLIFGDVICVRCGRSKPWDASLQLFNQFVRSNKFVQKRAEL